MRPNTTVSTARNSTTPVSYTHLRDDKHLYINGGRFPMRRLQRGEEQQLWLGNLSVTDRDFETELDAAATSIDRLVRDLSDNLRCV